MPRPKPNNPTKNRTVKDDAPKRQSSRNRKAPPKFDPSAEETTHDPAIKRQKSEGDEKKSRDPPSQVDVDDAVETVAENSPMTKADVKENSTINGGDDDEKVEEKDEEEREEEMDDEEHHDEEEDAEEKEKKRLAKIARQQARFEKMWHVDGTKLLEGGKRVKGVRVMPGGKLENVSCWGQETTVVNFHKHI
eukprot:jgi/Bigna1/129993/aug1.10_g4701